MARSPHNLLLSAAAAGSKLLLLLLATAAVAMAAEAAGPAGGPAGGEVVTFRHPDFNYTYEMNFELTAATNSSVFTPYSLFQPRGAADNASEGFLLLIGPVDLWGGGREASFNTSFTVAAGAAPIAFVVLRDRFPLLNSFPGGLRGDASYKTRRGAPARASATAAAAAIEVGPVMSYGPGTPAGGLNVTVAPRGAGGGCAVWIQHDPAAHRVAVRVAGAGEPRPAAALLDVPLGGAGTSMRWTTNPARVGFFGGRISDIVAGVRDWELTMDKVPPGEKSGAASGKKKRAMMVMAVMMSLAAIIV